MINCIAFHSYKGGTGKTTIASNLSAFLAKKGYNVCLLDLDVYAPSLQIYFEQEPKRWINDYLYSDARLEDVMTDLSFVIHKDNNYNNDLGNNKNENNSSNNNMDSCGKLLVAFSLTKKEEIYKFEGGTTELKKQSFRKLVRL